MRIDLPQCNLKTCRYCFDHNCTNKMQYEVCEYQRLRSYMYFMENENDLREHKADVDRISKAKENMEKYEKR